MSLNNPVSRRQFLKESGGLLIGFSLADAGMIPTLLAAPVDGVVQTPSPAKLESWLKIGTDGNILVFADKPEIGMGVKTALGKLSPKSWMSPLIASHL